MIVEELIEKLKIMPQNAIVKIAYIYDCYKPIHEDIETVESDGKNVFVGKLREERLKESTIKEEMEAEKRRIRSNKNIQVGKFVKVNYVNEEDVFNDLEAVGIVTYRDDKGFKVNNKAYIPFDKIRTITIHL